MSASGNWLSRGHLVYLFAIPLLPAFFTVIGRGNVNETLLYGAGLAGFGLASLLVRFGLKKQHRNNLSRYRRSRTHALVWLGALVTGATCFLCQSLLADNSFAVACMASLAGFVGVWMVYGAVKPDVELTGAHGYSPDEIALELAKAEEKLFAISQITKQMDSGDIQQRLRRIVRKSDNVLRQIQHDPADLRRARKFLAVFLPGTRDVTETYWKVHQSGSSEAFERRFRGILAKVEEIVEKQIQKLKDNEEFDLDVQMAVLRTQLENE